MECNKCHKNIQPLELYTGELACPKCKSNISLIPKHISAANPMARELISLSELYYHYALCKSARIETPELVSRCSLTTDEMIAKAVEYCGDALSLGHPEALYRMAFFYNKNISKSETTDSVRYRTAAQLYLALITNPDTSFEGYDSSGAADKIALLKKRAAEDLFHMLHGMSRRDRAIYAPKLVEYGYLTQEEISELSLKTVRSGAEELLSALEKSVSKHRAPLFGLIRVEKERLRRITEEILRIPSVKSQKIDRMFIPLNADDVYDFRNSFGGRSPFHVLRTTSDEIRTGAAIAADKSDEFCAVYFFNRAGKHRFYSSSSKKNKIAKSINNDSIDKLISCTRGSSFVFFDDDLYFKNGKVDRIITEISTSLEV